MKKHKLFGKALKAKIARHPKVYKFEWLPGQAEQVLRSLKPYIHCNICP